MESVTAANLRSFLECLGERYQGFATLYLLGGSALCLLGNPRVTGDVDYTYATIPEEEALFKATVAELAAEMRLDFEDVVIEDFVPLPPGAYERRQLIGCFGKVEAYIFDPYPIALSKIARGFEADLEDVIFMLREGLIELDELERFFEQVLPQAADADIIPKEFQAYFAEVRRSAKRLLKENEERRPKQR